MIWFFIAGFISGAVGVMMYARWWGRTHVTRITMEEFLHEFVKKYGYGGEDDEHKKTEDEND